MWNLHRKDTNSNNYYAFSIGKTVQDQDSKSIIGGKTKCLHDSKKELPKYSVNIGRERRQNKNGHEFTWKNCRGNM